MAYNNWVRIQESEPELKLKLLENVKAAEQNKKILYTEDGTSSKFNFVRPVTCSPIAKNQVKILDNLRTVEELLVELFSFEYEPLIAVDLETKGTEAHNPDHFIVGVGLASASDILYIPRQLDEVVWDSLLLWLSGQPIYSNLVHTKDNIGKPGSHLLSSGFQGELIAHNVYFDSSFLLRDVGWLNWKWCTHGLLRQLANEGFAGQKWGLKWAQTELLGWKETNEGELDQWLVENCHIKGSVSNKMKELEEGLNDRLEAWKNGTIRPNKSDMWQAPFNILGYYCGLDAASTYLLFTEVLYPAIEKLTEEAQAIFTDYHTELFITNCRLLVEQQLSGITIDSEKLVKYRAELSDKIQEKGQEFIDHPDISKAILKWDQQVLDAKLAAEPIKFKKVKDPPKEPNRYKKNGSESISWLNWQKRMQEWKHLNANPEVSKNWISWKAQVDNLKETVQFNINSAQQKRWLFYEELGFPVILKTEKGDPAVDKKALSGFGEPGRILKEQNDLNKESQYIDACLSKLRPSWEGTEEQLLHPQFRVPGTLTGRLAGSGGLNVQQVPKSRGYLECWVPRKGMVWVDCDVTSLEQVVLAELSKDPTLWLLYGPGAKPNDVYLFNGAALPGIGEQIKAAGYDPFNPTPEGIANAKSVAKKARSVSKVITLGSSYGMGPKKLRMTLALQGISVSEDEAYQMWAGYWKLYQGVKEYEKILLEEWKLRGGWLYNGMGRPVCVDMDYLKDIVNRVVQSTGHDILMLVNYHIQRLLDEAAIQVNGIVWDFHDETLVECWEKDLDKVCEVFKEAYRVTNQELAGSIPLKGDIQICRSLADAKFD